MPRFNVNTYKGNTSPNLLFLCHSVDVGTEPISEPKFIVFYSMLLALFKMFCFARQDVFVLSNTLDSFYAAIKSQLPMSSENLPTKSELKGTNQQICLTMMTRTPSRPMKTLHHLTQKPSSPTYYANPMISCTILF